MLLVVGLRRLDSMDADAPHLAFALLMAGAALALVVGLDFYRVEGDIDRMNSVFKFYVQVWVLLALAAAYLLWRLADRFGVSLRGASPGGKLWAAALAALVLSGSVYTVLGTRDRNEVRFRDGPLTLDGMAYMAGTVYREERGIRRPVRRPGGNPVAARERRRLARRPGGVDAVAVPVPLERPHLGLHGAADDRRLAVAPGAAALGLPVGRSASASRTST